MAVYEVLAEWQQTKWKTTVLKEQVPMTPKILKKSSSMCSFCCSLLEGSSHIKVMPKKKLGKKMKRVVKKYNCSGEFDFTKNEKVLWRKYQANVGNKLVLTCISCKNKTRIPMEKPTPVETPNEEFASEQPAKKKKKKKPKDHLAGLKMSVVTKSNSSILSSKLKVEPHRERNQDIQVSQPKKKNKVAEDNQTVNMKTKHKAFPHQSLPSTLKKNAKPSGVDSVAFKKFKKCNKLAEILAKSHNDKPASKKLKPVSMLNSLQLMLRKKNV